MFTRCRGLAAFLISVTAETGFIRPRDLEGRFLTEFDPRKAWIGFQEGNAWQYTFYVPHDPAGLIEKMGLDTFNQRLEDVFQQAEQTHFGGGTMVDAFAGVENVYNHGNQPSLHISWLFNYGGQPWRTQHWVLDPYVSCVPRGEREAQCHMRVHAGEPTRHADS